MNPDVALRPVVVGPASCAAGVSLSIRPRASQSDLLLQFQDQAAQIVIAVAKFSNAFFLHIAFLFQGLNGSQCHAGSVNRRDRSFILAKLKGGTKILSRRSDVTYRTVIIFVIPRGDRQS